MKIITLIAVLAVVLLIFSGMLPEGSVGGPMTLAAVFLVATLAVGAYEAWSMRRGVLGWIASVVTSVIGGIVGAGVGTMVLESAIVFVKPDTALAISGGPLLYIAAIAQMLFTLFGAWSALWVVNRWR